MARYRAASTGDAVNREGVLGAGLVQVDHPLRETDNSRCAAHEPGASCPSGTAMFRGFRSQHDRGRIRCAGALAAGGDAPAPASHTPRCRRPRRPAASRPSPAAAGTWTRCAQGRPPALIGCARTGSPPRRRRVPRAGIIQRQPVGVLLAHGGGGQDRPLRCRRCPTPSSPWSRWEPGCLLAMSLLPVGSGTNAGRAPSVRLDPNDSRARLVVRQQIQVPIRSLPHVAHPASDGDPFLPRHAPRGIEPDAAHIHAAQPA